MAPVPLIAIGVDGNRRDPIVPTLGSVVWKPDTVQVGHVVIDPDTHPVKIIVDEEAYPGVTKYTDRTDSVVKPGRQRGPAVTPFLSLIHI